MGMVVRSNIMALNANRQLGMNNSAVSKSLEKLSSGFKINRAGDDASGLAISEKMKAQIKGLDAASANAQDGISLVQTAEGALTEVHDMLNRMVELSEKSANGTMEEGVGANAGTDRQALQDEMDQLATEIDRIAKSTNFNNIKLLDGSLAGQVNTTTSAVATDPTATTDGNIPNAATEATVTLDFAGTGDTIVFGATTITGGSSKLEDLGNVVLENGAKISDLFEIKGGAAWDATVIADGDKIELVAKTAGALSNTAFGVLTGATTTGSGSIVAVNGTAEGAGAAATKAKYELEFDFTKLADGQTFEIGGKTFEISTDGVLNDANANIIDIKGLDLTAAAGQLDAAKAIQGAVDTAFNADFNVDGAPTAADITAAGGYKLTFEAKNAGDAGNMGSIRISNSASASGAIGGTYKAGAAAGKGAPGSFATVTYDLDLTKLAVGDELKIGNTKITIVDDADEDIANGKLGKTKAGTAADVISAFESNGYNAGKIAINGNELTITGTKVGEKGADLAAGQGKLEFNSQTVVGTTTTGGLVLQIGDTNDAFNKMSVTVRDMQTAALFSGADMQDANGNAITKPVGSGATAVTSLDISDQTKAGTALTAVKKVINTVSTQRAALGAIQNRLEHTINNLDVASENMSSANSRIRDTDMAKQMMDYTKMNVLTQAAQAMLAQANQQPQSILQLLQ